MSGVEGGYQQLELKSDRCRAPCGVTQPFLGDGQGLGHCLTDLEPRRHSPVHVWGKSQHTGLVPLLSGGDSSLLSFVYALVSDSLIRPDRLLHFLLPTLLKTDGKRDSILHRLASALY